MESLQTPCTLPPAMLFNCSLERLFWFFKFFIVIFLVKKYVNYCGHTTAGHALRLGHRGIPAGGQHSYEHSLIVIFIPLPITFFKYSLESAFLFSVFFILKILG
ncbi:hypothetical protein ACM40_18165 [Chryseobacterium sp. BLS98]|nr:hypothetical protein ACM40_18165 [Chryseobacterium sp. BLS98]